MAELHRRHRHRFHFPIHNSSRTAYTPFLFILSFTVRSIRRTNPFFQAIKLSVEWNIRYNSHALNNLQFRRPPLRTAAFTHHWLVCLRETVCTGKYWIDVITWMSTVNRTRRSMSTRAKPFIIYLPQAANEHFLHMQFGPLGNFGETTRSSE